MSGAPQVEGEDLAAKQHKALDLRPLYARGAEKIRAATLALPGARSSIEIERPFNRTRSRIDPASITSAIEEVLLEEPPLTVADDSAPWVLRTTIDGHSMSDGTTRTETHILTLNLVERASGKVLAEAKVEQVDRRR